MYTIRYFDRVTCSVRQHDYRPLAFGVAVSVARELSRDYHTMVWIDCGGDVIVRIERGMIVLT